MKVVIANVCGAANKGDAALLEALVSFIVINRKEVSLAGVALKPEMQRAHLPDITWHERPLTSHDSNLLRRRFRNLSLWIVGILYYVFPSNALRLLFPSGQRSAIKSIESADLVISCPGGYLEDSNYSYITNCFQLFLAIRARRKLVLAPQSIGPMRSMLGKILLKKLIGAAHLVYVRDDDSIRCIKEIFRGVIPVNVLKAGDMALWHVRNPADINSVDMLAFARDRVPLVGLSIIDWNFPGLSSGKELRARYLQELSQIVVRVNDMGGCCVCINQVSWDLHIAEELLSLVPKGALFVDKREHSASSLREMISRFDVFVGSRLHSCIFALLEGVPVLALAYLPKTHGIFSDLGLSSQVRDIDSFDGNEVLNTVLSLEKNSNFDSSVEVYRRSNDLSALINILKSESE